MEKLGLDVSIKPDLGAWKDFLGKLKNPLNEVKIGLIGKYIELQDAYKSIYESFVHAGAYNETKVQVISLHSEELEDSEIEKQLDHLDGILVAPGIGTRGVRSEERRVGMEYESGWIE